MFEAIRCLVLPVVLFSGLAHAGPSRPFEILTSLSDAKVANGSSAQNRAARNFFARFHNSNLTSGYYRSDRYESDFGEETVYFTRFHGGTELQDCPAIFCRDKVFFDRLKAEADSGRLLFLTHAFNDYSGLTFGRLGTVFSLKRNFPDIDIGKAIVVLTPTLNLYSLEHELVHAEDYEQGLLEPLEEWLDKASRKYGWKERLLEATNEMVAEVRAYDKERRMILTSVRDIEWTTARDRKGNEVIKIVETTGADFVAKEIKKLDEFATDYVKDFLKAIRGVRGQPRRELMNEVAKYLPADGPYSISAIESRSSRDRNREAMNSPRHRR